MPCLVINMDEPSESSELEIFKEFLFTLPDVLDSLTDGRFERPVLEEVACRQLYHEAIDCCFMLQNFLFNLSAVPPSPTIEAIEEGLSTLYTRVYDLSNFYSERLNLLTQDAAFIQCPTDNTSFGNGDDVNGIFIRRGRPSFRIKKEQLQGLIELGFSWVQIANLIGVSVDTLRRRRRNYGMDVGNGTDSQTTDDALDAAVLSILTVSPNSGERMVIEALRSRGIRVQRSRICGSICRVDPAGRSLRKKRAAIKRRRYNVATPNTLW